jgi:transposase
MSRRQKDPLRPLHGEERKVLSRLSRSRRAPAAQVARARALLAVADGQSYTTAAQLAGRRNGDTVARWVARFNGEGLAAAMPRHGGGHPLRYGAVEQRRILAELTRSPDRTRDGTSTCSLSTLQAALRRAANGLPRVSTYTIGRTLHEAGFGWQKSRTWCETGGGRAQAQAGWSSHCHRSGCRGKKGLIERAYTLSASLGLTVWCEDEAGPFQAVPHPGSSWQPHGRAATQPHEYVRGGTYGRPDRERR